ncbi:MAG: S1 RNA-binding domain-containing protein, partial [bacterium]|nr:S1 RNA-binding domain-containing protein [bacterium]
MTTTQLSEAEMGSSTGENFAELFENSLQRKLPEEGNIVSGTVLQIARDQVIVDFAYKCEGVINVGEFIGAGGQITVQVGDKLDVYFEGVDDKSCLAILSKEKADALKVWDKLVEASENEGVVEGTVLHKVKGGLSVDIGVKAFLPGSQVDIRPVSNFDKLIGKKFKFQILKLNKKKGNIIVSRRALLQKDRGAYREETLQNIQEGQTLKGSVKNITDYGVFVDLGGVDG